MAIYANTVIQDALALIDVVSPGEAADSWWSSLATRLLNGMLLEWSKKGYYNPQQALYELYPTITKDYFTVGIDDSLKTLSNTTYSIVATLDANGTYYRTLTTVDGKVYTKYSTTGAGSTYSLLVTADSTGTFYQINAGYSEKQVGDIPVNFSTVLAVQIDLGTVVYNPKQVTLTEYQSISVKQTQSAPSLYAYDFQQPIGKIYFWPKALPNMKLRIVGQPSIAAITNNQSKIALDDSMYTAILYNLAAKLYPFLKRDNGIDQEIVYMAKTALSAVRSKSVVMRSKHQISPFGGAAVQAQDYFTSALSTVNS